MSIRALFGLLKDAYFAWRRDQATLLSAAIAYYALFSLAPLLIVVVGTAGAVLGPELARGFVIGQLEKTLGPAPAGAIVALVDRTQRSSSGPLATALGAVVLLYGASRVFTRLQIALNTIWQVEPPRRRGILRLIRTHLLSFLMVGAIGVILIGTVLIGTALSLARRQLEAAVRAQTEAVAGNVPALAPDALETLHSARELVASLQLVDLALTLAMTAVLFALVYRFVPDTQVAWGDVWLGGLVAGALFAIGKLAIGLYLAYAGVASTYGAAGSIVVILLWVNYTAQILFYGAEVAKLHADRFGSRQVA